VIDFLTDAIWFFLGLLTGIPIGIGIVILIINRKMQRRKKQCQNPANKK